MRGADVALRRGLPSFRFEQWAGTEREKLATWNPSIIREGETYIRSSLKTEKSLAGKDQRKLQLIVSPSRQYALLSAAFFILLSDREANRVCAHPLEGTRKDSAEQKDHRCFSALLRQGQ